MVVPTVLAKVAALEPALVPKPWGREDWYSGVEARGESRVCTGDASVPLSEYLTAQGRTAPIVLLKVLRPTGGDLYMEVHEAKHEVYVVDAVDASRWPNGGAILLGANPSARAELGDEAFRDALRRRAEAAEAGRGSTEDVAALLVPTELRVGDVIAIPPGTPHSLLCGITVIEFQTPVFERRILAATGPVTTQTGWDVAAAVAAMNLDAAPAVVRGGGSKVVAETADFAVVRLTKGACRTVPPWSVGWVAAGAAQIGGRRFPAPAAFVAAESALVRCAAEAVVFVAVEQW